MEAGIGSGTVRVDSLKNDKQKRQHHKTRCWRNKTRQNDYSCKTAMIMPVEVRSIPNKKLGFFDREYPTKLEKQQKDILVSSYGATSYDLTSRRQHFLPKYHRHMEPI